MISVYSDGASAARGGMPGGWAFVVVRDETDVIVAGYGNDISTTNNVMELTGAIKGLEHAAISLQLGEIKANELIELVSDSQYVLGIASGKWNPTKNVELAKRLTELATQLKVRLRWVKGHSGNLWNERCDSLAGKGKAEAIAKAAAEDVDPGPGQLTKQEREWS